MIKILERLVRERERIPPEYLYYGIPSPWLQVWGRGDALGMFSIQGLVVTRLGCGWGAVRATSVMPGGAWTATGGSSWSSIGVLLLNAGGGP